MYERHLEVRRVTVLTNILHWLRKAGPARCAGVPTFESLEPRVLLSADLAGVQPVSAGEAIPADQAVSVDLNYEGGPDGGLVKLLDFSDTTPPNPDPSTWAAAPHATGPHSVLMVATAAADAGGVEYYFHEMSGNPGATDSDWQDSNVYEDTDLTPGMLYIYEVKTRDRSASHNEGAYSTSASVATPSPVYRFWSPVLQRHFYTINEREKSKLEETYADVWQYEKVAYYAFGGPTDPNAVPIYRFWSAKFQAHFYTMREAERDKLINQYPDVWAAEGVAFYAYTEDARPADTSPVYRFWSGRAHFYAIDSAERDKLLNDILHIWALELTAWYAFPA
jgi:hypothetical protein